jgi:phospholipid transport system transporter-binding protein
VTEVLEKSRELALPETGVVDLKGAEPVDSAAVALLLAWKRRADGEGRPLVFVELPPTLTSLASLYDVESFLGA